jgi:hypothetical protein
LAEPTASHQDMRHGPGPNHLPRSPRPPRPPRPSNQPIRY